MTGLLIVLAVLLCLPAIITRLFFLAPLPGLGTLYYFANIFSDFQMKRISMPRGTLEHLGLAGGLALALFLGPAGWLTASILASLVAVLEIALRVAERRVFNEVYVRPDSRRRGQGNDQSAPGPAGSLPSPTTHPVLLVNCEGPFVERRPSYDLGDLAVGRKVPLTILVGNHSVLPGQVPVSVEVQCPSSLELTWESEQSLGPLSVGEVGRFQVKLLPNQASERGQIVFALTHGDQQHQVQILIRSTFDPKASRIEGAAIERYAGARRSGFAWRGDMDLYDQASSQSIEGLEHTFGLAARYRFPQTMYLSARLSLDEGKARAFGEHFGVDRGHGRIPDFIQWMKDKVDLQHRSSYPFESEKPYLIELGNHMYLHYGTDAAADEENRWRLRAQMGAGEYGWQGEDRDSFAEQRDNAIAAKNVFEEKLGYTPVSWAMPDSTNDKHTPAAVEAAGCRVLSDSNAKHKHNVIFQPPPHHPKGTKAVELTKRYPGDPQDLTHLQMFYYWLHRGWRKAIPVVFMCHQHLRLYEGRACTRFTEHALRTVLSRFNGDFHIDTVYGIGIYWNEVFSPEHRTVHVEHADGAVRVRNEGQVDLRDVPVTIRFGGGRRSVILVDLPAGARLNIDASGAVQEVE